MRVEQYIDLKTRKVPTINNYRLLRMAKNNDAGTFYDTIINKLTFAENVIICNKLYREKNINKIKYHLGLKFDRYQLVNNK